MFFLFPLRTEKCPIKIQRETKDMQRRGQVLAVAFLQTLDRKGPRCPGISF
jgi:hypothetical protein